MNQRNVGVLAGLVAVLGTAAHVIPDLVVDRWVGAGVGDAVPVTVGTLGQTVTAYRLVAEVTGPLVTVALGLGLGYYAGRRLQHPGEYRRFARTVAAGSTLVAVPAAVLLFALWTASPIDAGSVLLWGLTIVRWVVAVPLLVTVSAFAAAAFVGFRRADADADGTAAVDDGGPGEPTTDAPTSANGQRATDSRSRPAR